MAKAARKDRERPADDARQVNFNFFLAPQPQSPATASEETDFELGLRLVLKQVLATAATRVADPLDRVEIAARMSRLLKRDLGKVQIDQWVAPSQQDRHIHVDALWALCRVTGDMRPMHHLVEALDHKALTPKQAKFAAFGAAAAVEKRMARVRTKALSEIDDADVDELLMDMAGGAP